MVMMTQWPQSSHTQLGCAVDIGQQTAAENDVPSIFSDILTVHVKPAGRDEFTAALTIRLRPDNVAHPRNLLVELTDENDLLFYHSLMLGEGDFHALKTEQRLRVDFQAFPAQLIDLLRRCMADTSSGNGGRGTEAKVKVSSPAFPISSEVPDVGGSRLGEASRMLAHLECSSGGDSIFSIIESNTFRELTHIAIRLRQGTDVAVKQHLKTKLQMARADAKDLAGRLRTSDDQLSQLRRQNEELLAQARSFSEERSSMERTLDEAHQRELAETRAQSAHALYELQRSVTEDRTRFDAEAKQRYEATLARAEASERSNEELKQREQTLSISLKSCQERLEGVEAQLREARLEESQLRQRVKDLEVIKFKHDKEIGEFNVQVSGLRGQISAKEQLVASQVAQLEQSAAQRRILEESVQSSKQHVVSLEEKYGVATQEIVKGNQIIKSLHTNLKQAKAKLKEKAKELAQHEKSILDLERTTELNKHVLDEKENAVSRGNEKQALLVRDTEDLKTKLGEAHDVLKTNQEVIEYLNKQLTERDLKGITPLAGFELGKGIPQFSPGVGASSGASTSIAFGGARGSLFQGVATGAARTAATMQQFTPERMPPRGHDYQNIDDLLRTAAGGALSSQFTGVDAKLAPSCSTANDANHLRGPIAYRSPVQNVPSSV
jgi:spindle assembly abnormal protein 6